jgi:hypothetical protein
MSIEGLYDTSFFTTRYSMTPSSGGGQVDDASGYLSGVPCRVVFMTGAEKIAYGKDSSDIYVNIFCDPCDLQETDSLYIDLFGYPAPQYCRIDSIENCYEYSNLHHLEVIAEVQKYGNS